jgi:DNA modification methylase
MRRAANAIKARSLEMRQGDCLEVMRTLEGGGVDVILTDPPYGEHTHNCVRRTKTTYSGDQYRASANRVVDLGFEHLKPWDREAAAMEFGRLARRWVAVFSDVEGFPGWRADLEAAGLEFVRCCFWHKLASTPQFTGDRPASHVEAIILAHKRKPNGKPMKKRWNGGGDGNVFEHAIETDRQKTGSRVHTTQKPLSLMLELVELFSDEGELILDPYAGSGTTGVACHARNRNFLGIELDQDYVDIARRRIAGQRAKPLEHQQELF